MADEAHKAQAVLELIDAACVAEIKQLALGEVFSGGDRPWWRSSRSA